MLCVGVSIGKPIDFRLSTIIGPNRDYLGYCSQVYLWAGASFPKDDGAKLNDLLALGVGQGETFVYLLLLFFLKHRQNSRVSMSFRL